MASPFLTIDPNHARKNVPQTALEALQLALDRQAPNYVPTAERVRAQQSAMSPAGEAPNWSSYTDFLDLNGVDSSPTIRTAEQPIMRPGMTQAQKIAINRIDPRFPSSIFNGGQSDERIAQVPNSANGSAIVKSQVGNAPPEMGYLPEARYGDTNPALAAIADAMPPMPRVRPEPPGIGRPVAVTVRGGNQQPSGDYTVKKGDTFWGISQRTGVPISVLMANAGSPDPRKLQVGTRLNLGSAPTSAPMPRSPSRVMIAARNSSSQQRGPSSDQKGAAALRAAGWMDEFGMIR